MGVRNYAIILVTIGIVAGILYFYYSETVYQPPSGPYGLTFEMLMTIEQPNNTQVSYDIPANIGVNRTFWNYHALDMYGLTNRAPMYTLDTTGLVRIQSSVNRNYTLADFFHIWGNVFNSTCVQVTNSHGQVYCDKTGWIVALYVNGKLNNAYDAYVPLVNDVVRIAYQKITG